MLNRLYHEERRWLNWLEFATFVGKSRWRVIKSPELVDRLASGQNTDNYQIYNGSVFKRKAGVSGSVFVSDVYVPEK